MVPFAAQPVCQNWAAIFLLSVVLAWRANLLDASSVSLVVVNDANFDVNIVRPFLQSIPSGARLQHTLGAGSYTSLEAAASSWTSNQVIQLPPPLGGTLSVVRIDSNGSLAAFDTNDLQLEMSRAAHDCHNQGLRFGPFQECIADHSYSGLPREFSSRAWKQLWQTDDFWQLCEITPPAAPLRRMTLKSGDVVEVLQDSPLVAVIHNFLPEQSCQNLLSDVGKDDLIRAHVGGSGSTQTTESRETLTKNLFIDWEADSSLLTQTAVRMMDIVSELMNEKVPYEGQEPINLLHYLPGYEYKPHTDGAGESLGKRVSTTLIYCEAAVQGGATVFTNRELRFQPAAGDLLFFKYQPNPYDAQHAACPVVEGQKTTLTQWYRIGVSIEKPWHRFENWGEFWNPHGNSLWKGPRYGKPSGESAPTSEL